VCSERGGVTDKRKPSNLSSRSADACIERLESLLLPLEAPSAAPYAHSTRDR
jgi:hypothetical protein